jgi:hypothetical protein
MFFSSSSPSAPLLFLSHHSGSKVADFTRTLFQTKDFDHLERKKEQMN